jgi:hypothetical protein
MYGFKLSRVEKTVSSQISVFLYRFKVVDSCFILSMVYAAKNYYSLWKDLDFA